MSSSEFWDEDQGSSRPHQCVRRTSLQPAKLSEDCASLSQPLELEDKSSQAKTTKSGIYMLGLALALVIMFQLLLQEKMMLQQRVLAAVVIVLVPVVVILMMLVQVVPVQILDRQVLQGRVLMLVPVVLALGAKHVVPLLLQQPLLAAVVVALVLVLMQGLPVLLQVTLDRIMNFWRARMHKHGGRLVKWGPHEWVLDSGAWNHHTSNLELLLESGDFQSHQEMDNKDAPSNGDDAAAPDVQGRGSVRTDCFDFPDVHYVVGDDTRNVVSVSQLFRDHGLVTVFQPTSCHVKEETTGKIVGKGRQRNGMYILDSLRIGQYIAGDRGASIGGKHGDGGSGHGGGGNIGEGDSSMAEGHGGGGRSRDARGGGTGSSSNQEQGGSGSGAAGGDIKDEDIVNKQEEGSSEIEIFLEFSENEIQEMNDENVDEDDNGKANQEINGNGEEDKERGGDGSTFGESSSKARRGLSRLVFVLCLCIACITWLQCTSRRTEPTILPMDFRSLHGFSFLFILSLELLTALSFIMISYKRVKQIGSLFRGRSTEGITGDHYEQNRRLFGLSRFDVSTDPTGHGRRQLPAGAFPSWIPSWTNTARREEFLVDSGASFHATWNEMILVSYPMDLKDHTEPPTRYFGGIIGSIKVTRSGYLSGHKIKLDGVLLAPKSRMNLVSVGQLSIQYDVDVIMGKRLIIKKRQDGVQIGGGKMLNNHQYELEYFQPGYLFAVSPTPDFKVFGTRRPGQPQVNTVPSPARSTTTEETGAISEETGEGHHESRAVRKRKLNMLVTGPMWTR